MQYSEYKEIYGSQVQEMIHDKLYKAFKESIDSNKLSITENIKGHKMARLERITAPVNSSLSKFINGIILDLEHQDKMNKILVKVSKGSNENVEECLDVEDILKGNLHWQPKGIFLPDYSNIPCGNDGLSYVVDMTDWHINLYERSEWIKDNKVEIKPFMYDNSPVKETIEFKTGNMVAMNFLPDDLSDFISEQYEKSPSPYGMTGRNWNKIHGETMMHFGILRTPTHIGGTLVSDNGNLVVGFHNDSDETETPNVIGNVETDVWQTLIMDQSDAIKLIMLARNVDQSDARSQLDNMAQELAWVYFKIEPGIYNAYYIPEMNDGVGYDTKTVFPSVNVAGYSSITPDIIITKDDITVTKEIDTTKVCHESDVEKVKKLLNSISNEISEVKPTSPGMEF